jgi:hypothetical protein
MNKLKNLLYILGISLVVALTGCSEPDDEITSLDYDRLFSPTDLQAKVVNKVNVTLLWNAVKGAESYQIEIYDNEACEGTPVKTAQATTNPFTIEGLNGDTKYWVRVKAVGATESKWVVASFTTDINSVLLSIEIGDITANDFTIRWTPGVTATKVTLKPKSGGSTIEYSIPSADATSGVAKVSGLDPSTEYDVVLYNGSQRIGLTTIETLAEGTVFVYPEDDLATIISSASDGDMFMLMPGTYDVAELNISSSITINAASAEDKPVLASTIIRPENGAAVTLKNLVLDGTGSTGDQTIVYPAGEFGDLLIDGCELKNYTKGTLYVNNATKIASVTITNCLYHEIECNGGDFIDFRNGIAETFTFKYNTVYNSALARDLFRMDAGGSSNFSDVTSIITIEENTFYKVCNGTSRRILYIRLAKHEIYFNKNIIAETQGYYSNQAATTITEMLNNNYFNAPNFTASTQTNAKNDTGSTYTTLDPQFKDADNGDFTLQNISLNVGDPRWR